MTNFSPFDSAFVDAISNAVAEKVTEKVIARLGTAIHQPPPTSGDRFLSRDDVVAVTSLCRESIRLLVNDGAFPKPININGRRVAWRESDVKKWMDDAGK